MGEAVLGSVCRGRQQALEVVGCLERPPGGLRPVSVFLLPWEEKRGVFGGEKSEKL